ncbi:MAG: radical SAM protein [Microgenomates group bacterium]
MKLDQSNSKSLENIYISPLELCNLSCLYCYTHKTKSILTNSQILDFVKNYNSELITRNSKLKSIIFCGGEVFTLPKFTNLVNQLLSQNIFISIITNGTIDKLDEISEPHNCQLIVSFDGPEQIHDQNRGEGNFAKSKAFVEHALSLGFPVEIFYLVTKDSYPHFKTFQLFDLHITYLTDRLGSLTREQVSEIRQNYPCYPPKDFGCNIFSLQSDGKFYGCCESTRSIGSLTDPLDKILAKYTDIITQHPLCSDPNYWCDLKPQ